MPKIAFSLGVKEGTLGMMLLKYYCYLLLPEASCYDMMVDGTSWYYEHVGIFLFPEQVGIFGAILF